MFSRRMSTAVVVLLVLLVTFALVASALPVFASSASALPAHARLVTTTPDDGAEVATARSVSMTFSEDVDERFLRLQVAGPGGAEADGDPEVDGRTVTQALADDLPAGEHTVTYRVVSVDGHPVSGSFAFTTTEEPAAPSPSASPTATASASASASASPEPSTTGPGATPTVTVDPASSDADSSPGWVLPVLLLVVVALLGGLVALLAGRRGTPSGDAPDDERSSDFTRERES